MLHGIREAANGGESVLVDGIKAANVLREKHPEYYKILTETNNRADGVIAYKDRPQFYHTNSCPIINLNEDGEPEYIRWSNPSHSTFFEGTAEEYEKFIMAFKQFYKILYDCAITVKIKPGK